MAQSAPEPGRSGMSAIPGLVMQRITLPRHGPAASIALSGTRRGRATSLAGQLTQPCGCYTVATVRLLLVEASWVFPIASSGPSSAARARLTTEKKETTNDQSEVRNT